MALIGLSGKIKRDEKVLHSKVISTDLDVVLRTFINLVSSKSSLEFTADLNRHLTKYIKIFSREENYLIVFIPRGLKSFSFLELRKSKM